MHPKTLKGSQHLNIRRGRNYGTETLIEVIEGAMRHVHEHHPETPKLYVGDLSDADGGHLGRHVSHQCGRDADIGYFRDGPLHEEHRLIATKPDQLDPYRTWTLLAYLLEHPKVQAIYSDKALIERLYEHARSLGHSEAELVRWFGPKVGDKYSGSKLRHWDGHTTHFHLRVRTGDAHRSWQDMTQTLDANTLTMLKRKTRPVSKKNHSHDVPNAHRPTVAKLSQPPVQHRRLGRSRSAQRARNRARSVRLKARLLAAQARAEQRYRLGLNPNRKGNAPASSGNQETDIRALDNTKDRSADGTNKRRMPPNPQKGSSS